jgi:DNA-binding MarR family transcriptional regulator
MTDRFGLVRRRRAIGRTELRHASPAEKPPRGETNRVIRDAAEIATILRDIKELNMAANPTSDHLVGVLRDTVVALVRRDGADLSARQLGVFLTCYLQEGGHTVRGLAADLNVSKPAITRALDRLGELDLARRKVDPMDRRSVLVQRTLKGTAFLRDLRGIMTDAGSPKKTSHETGRRAAAG